MTRIPQYRRLYEILRKHIDEGVYSEGDLLPSENELCTVHDMTRPTVRHALDTLVNDGYIHKKQGKGSIVNAPPTGIGILSVEGTTTAVGRKDLKTKIIQKPAVALWPSPFIFPLSDPEKESGCICMERLRLLNDQPLFLDINYLPNINIPRFTVRQFEDKSLFNILRKEYGIEIKGGEQKLRAVQADAKVAALLGIRKGAPVLYIQRRLVTNRAGYYVYSALWCNTQIDAIYGTF